MFLRELFEESDKTAVVTFGRMNPPTIGHQKLVDKVKSIPGDHFVFLSQTQNPKKDPLDFHTKLKFAQAFFPDVTIGSESVRTPIDALKKLDELGYDNIMFVVGSDRLKGFEFLHKYNGKEYNFNNIEIVSAGERDPDADGAEGMSASKMREAAATGNFEAFVQGVPNKKLAEKMYQAVRNGMGIKDTVATEDSRQGPSQQVSRQDLQKLEKYLDDLFSKVNIDVEFTRHFLDRVNDPRNKRNITVDELSSLFKNTYKQWGKKIAQMGPDAQAVIKAMASDINVPFVLDWDRNAEELDLIAKTAMRKKNFRTPDQVLQVETAYAGNIGLMELMKFFAKAKKTDPTLVSRVKELIKNKRDKEVWKIVQDYTGTELQGNEFTESIHKTIVRYAIRRRGINE